MFPNPEFVGMSLSEARAWLRERVNEGARCPCCTQWSQCYWRSINAGMAVGAVRLYRWQLSHPGEFAHLPSVVGRRSAEEAKLRYWSLIEEEPSVREDGGHTGRWRLTAAGMAWARGDTLLPRYVKVYDGRALGPPLSFSRTGQRKPLVSIKDALGDRFSYDALMAGEG